MLLPRNIVFVLALVTLCYFFNLNLLSQIIKPKIAKNKYELMFNVHDNYLKVFHLGQKRFFSSMLWVHTLLTADESHYKGDDLNNWIFLRFKSIALLDPRFYENYRYGGIYLSIVKDDDLGAKYIYDRGLSYYPNDYLLNYFAAYHYYFELKELKKALVIYRNLLTIPNALTQFPLLPRIISRLEASEGNLNEAFEILLKVFNQLPDDSILKKRYEENLYALKAEKDLECLNIKKLLTCDLIDFRGEPYIQQLDKTFVAKFSWQQFRRIK